MAILSQRNDHALSSIKSLANEPWLKKRSVVEVFRALKIPGHTTRIVGGAIRNAIFGVAVVDIDMATTLKPDEVMAAAAGANIKAVPTGIAHGTVTLVLDGDTIEVTTLRADIDSDGRHASVVFGTDWRGDALRRDFTVNALYCDPVGELFDPLGGMDDILARRIKFIGEPEKRVAEDYLRILRFIRFHGAYGSGPIDALGMSAVVRGRLGLGLLSRERIWSEFSKILVLDKSSETIDLMFEYGLLVDILGGAPQLGKFRRLVKNEKELQLKADAVRRLGALGLFVPDDASRLGARFRLSRGDLKRLGVIGANNWLVEGIADLDEARRRLYRLGRIGFQDLVLVNFECGVGRANGVTLDKLYNLSENWTRPEFPIDGGDLKAFGIRPGPEMGRLLLDLENYWVAADFKPDRSALLACLKELL